jgi:hypothetical protein
MKKLWISAAFILLNACIISCRKTSFIESADALISTSADTLRFDTVFTTTGSVTYSFKIFNQNDKKLKLKTVKLAGGSTSPFKINVDGTAGTTFSNIEMEANDSLYVFVSVSINPSAANLPFVVQDSILINYNGNDRLVQLEAFGQNANFLRSRRVTRDSSWNNNLPFVILGSLTVDPNVTLNINKGCKIYSHADAPIIINGSLKVNGEKFDSTRVAFQGDRLDAYYREFPGSWPGIYFTSTSRDNVLNYAIIKNAYQGIVTQLLPSNSNAKVTLNECIIDNIYDAGILSINSSINARNCLISNCGTNIGIAAGGNYNFTHCTVASYSTLFVSHKNPVLFISNVLDQAQTLSLNANFRNCIFFGEGGIIDDEIQIERKGTTAFNLSFQNILYKAKNNINPAPVNSFRNEPPRFDSVDISKRYFNFRLQQNQSPAIDKGLNAGVLIDLDGNPRPRGLNSDIGCYEKQ